MAGQRAALRLLLVVLVTLGVAGMHTLGHPMTVGMAAPCRRRST
ncbi:hypothetical protein [Phytohabitans rumicis]|nr:hypothetical protein [Phytohabitans rumicis]